jgi:hypothetical protein
MEAMVPNVKPLLPTVHRIIKVELIRDGGSLAAMFEADGGGEYTLFMRIKVAASGSPTVERLGYHEPILIDCDPTKRPPDTDKVIHSPLGGPSVSVSWNDARALLHAISNLARGLSRHRSDLLAEMESIVAAEGRLPSRPS